MVPLNDMLEDESCDEMAPMDSSTGKGKMFKYRFYCKHFNL